MVNASVCKTDDFIGFDSRRRLYNSNMGMKPRVVTARRRRVIKCLRCPTSIVDPVDLPIGWESRLAIHLNNDKYTHLCPKCVIG